MIRFLYLVIVFLWANQLHSQQSIARLWNEEMLHAIRNDFARPTIHARNLYHSSILMYDSWALLNDDLETVFLGKTIGDFSFEYDSTFITIPETYEEKLAAADEIMSYALFTLMQHRFAFSPRPSEISTHIANFMLRRGYSLGNLSTNYTDGTYKSLGVYMGRKMIEYGLQDGSNENNFYRNQIYTPVNDVLVMARTGNPGLSDPNRWQQLSLEVFIDQSGNVVPGFSQPFLSPEWGNVEGFALTEDNLSVKSRDGNLWNVYHDPGPPPRLFEDNDVLSADYKWGFLTVLLWSAHLDEKDTVMWDISPATFGNSPIESIPKAFKDYDQFYNQMDGGTWMLGRSVNPITGQPYEPNIVKRGDYARVLAEFWADGPDSETPPGHWFEILNKVMDDERFERKWYGRAEELSPIDYEVRAYLTMGGAMHDAAIAAWSIKGYYDYIRPVSAIRYMAGKGQCTDPNLPSYHSQGLPLIPGYIEIIGEDDELAGGRKESVGKIKVRAWRGPDYIRNPLTDDAGVGWIKGEDWWPYQRPSFVTPPFAGYVSGHSVYSRAAAEVMTAITGSEYFPGGLGEFDALANSFLVFERGPSQDVILQWATYRDASDQTSLSRIWGGIHPPADDLPGRRIGIAVAEDALRKVNTYFKSTIVSTTEASTPASFKIYPNPSASGSTFTLALGSFSSEIINIEITNAAGTRVYDANQVKPSNNEYTINSAQLGEGLYFVRLSDGRKMVISKMVVVK